MKQLLRLVLSRKQYRALRTAMRTADAVSDATDSATESTDSSQASGDTATHQQLADNPNIPTDGSPIETPTQLTAVLQQMDPYEFEYFVADLWENMDWETTVSTESADKGIDVTARKSTPYDQLVLIQAKRYGPNTTVGSPEIQQYASLKHQQNGVDKVVVVTTNAYTQQARELADKLNVKLIDGDELVELIDRQEALDLVAKYLAFIEPADTDAESTAAVQDDVVSTDEGPGEAESTSDAETAQPAAVDSTVWHKLIAVTTLGWLAVFAGGTVLSDAVFGLVLFASWIGLPVGIYLDSRRLPVGWPTRTWAYILGSLVPLVALLAGVIYLWRRRSISA